MKLHLPKKLVTALMAAFAVVQTTWAVDNEIWVNFGCVAVDSTTVPEGSGMVTGDLWNNITKPLNNGHATGIYTLNNTESSTAAVLDLQVNANCWGPSGSGANVMEQMQASYLDVNGENQKWTMDLLIDDISANNVKLTLYFSGDNGKYDPINVNGTYYIGGTDTKGDNQWGDRNYRPTVDTNNTIIVNNVGSCINMASINKGGRATVSGMSLSYTSELYAATLIGGNNAAADLSYTYGENTVGWDAISTADSYIEVTGAEDGTSVYTIAAGSDMKGIQVNNTVTLSSTGAITVDKLWATYGAELNIDALLAENSDVEIDGAGKVYVNTNQNIGNLILNTDIEIAENVTITLSGANSTVKNGSLSGSGKISLQNSAGLNIDSSDLAHILTYTEGSGTINVSGGGEAVLTGSDNHGGPGETIKTNPNVTSYSFGGVISMAADTKLVLGNAVQGNYTHTGWAVALENATVAINGGGIRFNGHYSTIGTLDVNANDTLHIYDAYHKNDVGLTIKNLKLDANLKVTTQWKGFVNIQTLNGTGSFSVEEGNEFQVSIDSITTSGAIENKALLHLGKDANSILNLGGNVTNTGTLNIKGQLAGTSSISGGTINVLKTASVSGNISFDSNVTLGGTLANTGTVTLNGNVSVSSLDALSSVKAYTDNNGKDGYLISAQYIVVNSTGTGTSNLGSDNLTLNEAYTLEKDGQNIVVNIVEENPTSGAYYVNTTVDYVANSVIAADTTTGITMNGGTLNLNTALADGISISTEKTGSVINVANGVTLANSSVTSGSTKATITGGSTAVYNLGTGLYIEKMADNGSGANVNFGEQWEGITLITNSHIAKNELDQLTNNGKGSLKLVGLSGWLVRGQTVNSDIILENYSTDGGVSITKSAFVFDDNSEDNYTFAGDISGSGDFQIASKSSSWANLFFSGATDEWTGGIIVTNAYKENETGTNTVTVNLTGGGDIFSADGNKGFVMDRASTNNGVNIINLNIGNAEKESTMNGAITMGENTDERTQLNLAVTGDTTFKKDVEVTSLTVNTGKTATLEGTTTTGSLTTAGTVNITGTGSLTYGGNTTVSAQASQTYTMAATGATITADAITGGTVTFSGDSSVTENRTISNSAIVNNATGSAVIKVGKENYSLYAANGNIEMTTPTEGTSVGDVQVNAGKNITSNGNLSVENSLTLNGATALNVTGDLNLSNATTLTLDGLNASNWASVTGMLTMSTGEMTLGGDILSSLAALEAGSQLELFNVGSLTLGGIGIEENLTATDGHTLDKVFTNGLVDYYLGYTAPTGNVGGVVYIGKVVPEPTTATLSLLALAALAARRRRK